MEYDAPRVLGLQLQYLEQVPCDSLSFAVFIGCEPHHLGPLGCFLQLGYESLLVVGNLIYRGEVVVDVDTEALTLQIPDVAVARHHGVVLTEKLLDGLGLGRRLYYY